MITNSGSMKEKSILKACFSSFFTQGFTQGFATEGEVRRLLNRFKPASNFVLLIVPRRYFWGGSFCFVSWCLIFYCAVGALCVFS